MAIFSLPIVGSYYRPPAEAILRVLRLGVPLTLESEPSNPADPNAIKVMLRTGDIPVGEHEELAGIVENYGANLADILSNEWIHIGYIPAKEAIWVVDKIGGTIVGSLGFTPAGKPAVIFELGI